MANKYTVMSEEAIRYLCGLIRDVVSPPSEIISNTSLADNLTFSNIYIKDLVEQCLQDANEYSNEVVNSLTHLMAEKINFEPTLDNTTDKINTLLLYSANNDNNYTQYLRLTNELLNIGDTSLSLNGYMKEVDADTKYTLKTTTDTLTTEVTNIKTDFNTHKYDTDIHITANERTKWNDATNEEKVKDIIDSEITTKGVCTTKVADVDKVVIPLTGVTHYKTSKDCECFYTVKNGICFVCLTVDCVTPQSDVFVGNVPAPHQVFRFSMARIDGVMHGYVLTNGKLYLNGGTAGTSYYVTTFSYPVAES